MLTAFRLFLSIPLVYFILEKNNDISLIIFLLGLASDLDGAIARRLNQVTKFGGIFDPVADGIFIIAGVFALVFSGKLDIGFVLLLIIINIPRFVYSAISIKKLGKIKSEWYSKFSGILTFLIIPLAIVDFIYLDAYIFFVIIFTVIAIATLVFNFDQKNSSTNS